MPNNPNEMKPDGTTKIKIIKLINGTDIVCEIAHAEQNKPLLTLDKPLEVKYVPQITNIGIKDYIALVKWAGYTNDKLVTIPKDKIVTMTNASSEIIKSYNEVKLEYDRKPEPVSKTEKYKRERFSDSENKKLNEIFLDYYDDDDNGTLH